MGLDLASGMVDAAQQRIASAASPSIRHKLKPYHCSAVSCGRMQDLRNPASSRSPALGSLPLATVITKKQRIQPLVRVRYHVVQALSLVNSTGGDAGACACPGSGCRRTLGTRAASLADLQPLAGVFSCFGLQQMPQPERVLHGWLQRPGAPGTLLSLDA